MSVKTPRHPHPTPTLPPPQLHPRQYKKCQKEWVRWLPVHTLLQCWFLSHRNSHPRVPAAEGGASTTDGLMIPSQADWTRLRGRPRPPSPSPFAAPSARHTHHPNPCVPGAKHAMHPRQPRRTTVDATGVVQEAKTAWGGPHAQLARRQRPQPRPQPPPTPPLLQTHGHKVYRLSTQFDSDDGG
jgi:hypothetical protein